MGFTSPSVQKIYSCQGNKRWSAHAFAYHPVITPQEALSQLVWAIPLPIDTSSATSHPFPAVLCGTHQLWHFLYLILPKGISSDWSKQRALISSVHAHQKEKTRILASFMEASRCQTASTKTLQRTCLWNEISHILKESLAIKTLVPWANKHLSSFTPILAVRKLFLRYS